MRSVCLSINIFIAIYSAQAQMMDVLDVPGPMSNGAGYLFSVLMAVKEEYNLDEVGRSMSSDLLCTCRGGLCATPSGRRCSEFFFKNRK